ncbi:nephrin [Strongylocentrotus purpuratus]|uniref:Uncharacterized protein n=1 Tax=Strongylocentrotus purpuratus TaxID=7668 RepID=A0A7M7HKR8_STRPU|nr:nephrin [Strongylocentrotus purpuratus]
MAPSIWIGLPNTTGAVVIIIYGIISVVTGLDSLGIVVHQTGLAIAGRSAILRCDYRPPPSTPAGLVYWDSDTRGNFISGKSNSSITNIIQPQKYRMWFVGASNAVLEILNVDFDDEMSYTCLVITQGGSGGSDEFNLVVLVPPSGITVVGISPVNREVVVISGQPYTLTCTSGSSKPSASITWSKVDMNFDLQLRQSDQFNNASAMDARTVITWRNATFTPNLAHDRKRLQCSASHQALSSQITTRVILRVMALPREMSLKDADSDNTLTGNLEVDDGDTMNFECSVLEASPAATLAWTIGQPPGLGETVDAVSMVTIRGERLMDTISRIQLNISSELHHNQLLTCEATIRIGSAVRKVSRSVTLQVHGPPNEVTIAGANDLMEGTSSRITCTVADAFPEPKVIWDIDGQDVTGMTNKEASETTRGRFTVVSTLRLDAVRADNRKVAMCSAIHIGFKSGVSHVTNATITLNVRYCPLNISATCPVVRDGGSAIVTCGQVTSNPATVVSIIEEGMTVLRTRTMVDYRDVTSLIHGVTTEVIYDRYFTKDQGPRDFQCCTVPSTLCPDEICQSCIVDIQYPPEVFPVPEGLLREVKEGESINLTCCADANPTPKGMITWHSEGLRNVTCSPEGHSQSAYMMRQSTGHVCSVLTFAPVTAGDAGIHKCVANNGFDTSFSASFELQVAFPPCTSTDEGSILENEGNEATLYCDVISNPPSEVTWYFNDEPIDMSSSRYRGSESGSGGIDSRQISVEMEIKAISASLDAGNYTCVANNLLGIDASVVELIIATIPDRPTELQAPRNSIRETSLLVTWKPGYNGGRRQTFRLAYCLVDSVTSCPELSNLQNSSFTFVVDTLKPFTLYTIRVWSENEVGQSEHISMTNSTKPLSPSDLGFEISYSPSQGVVIMQFVGGSTMEGAIPNDLCIQVEVNLGQDWVTREGCLNVGVVKTVQRDLLAGQLRGISCGRGLCSVPSMVVVQNNQEIPWIIIIIIASAIGGVILLVIIILLCRCMCRKRKRSKETIRTLSKIVTSDTVPQSPSSCYQPLAFSMPPKPTSPPPTLPPDRLNAQGNTDDDDYEDFTYAIPDQPRDRAFMHNDSSMNVPFAETEDADVFDDGYIPMATFKKPSMQGRPPKPLPKPTETYDTIKGQIYENLRI